MVNELENTSENVEERRKPDFGAWTNQVRAVAIAHYFVAAAHFCIVFYVRQLWNKAIESTIEVMGQITGSSATENATVLGEMHKLDYFVYIFYVVIAIFTILIAWNGILVLRGKNGARIGAIVLGAFLVVAFPVGTIIGPWFIYVMVQREVVEAYVGRKGDYFLPNKL
jgi:hypothetical protein